MRSLPLVLLAVACSPVTTRPAFGPVPQATQLLVVGEPAAVTRHAAEWIAAAGVPTVRASEVDRYIETGWYSPPADSSVTRPFPFRVKTRVWVNPGGAGRSLAFIETVYRPVDDPSRPSRDLEVAVPRDAGADRLAVRLLTALREKFEAL